MNLTIKTKNYAADPELGFLTKSISKPTSRATAMPTAWELIKQVAVMFLVIQTKALKAFMKAHKS